jgi:N utilization substance protein B
VSSNKIIARESAFQFLYHLQLPIFETIKKELLSSEDDELLEQTFDDLESSLPGKLDKEAKHFAISLIKGVLKDYYSLSQTIDKYLENWKLDRLPKVDLTILLLACFELTQVQETPPKVVISEANNMAKKFSAKESNSFINAVLDKILKNEK